MVAHFEDLIKKAVAIRDAEPKKPEESTQEEKKDN